MLTKMVANGMLQPEKYWVEVAANLKLRTASTNQPSQVCVDSSTPAYKNANLFVTAICIIFDWHLWKLSTTDWWIKQ